jgi:hypothetical protein
MFLVEGGCFSLIFSKYIFAWWKRALHVPLLLVPIMTDQEFRMAMTCSCLGEISVSKEKGWTKVGPVLKPKSLTAAINCCWHLWKERNQLVFCRFRAQAHLL